MNKVLEMMKPVPPTTCNALISAVQNPEMTALTCGSQNIPFSAGVESPPRIEGIPTIPDIQKMVAPIICERLAMKPISRK
jgi:hypothetical protein